jgi:TM2 domain-containing membrane protein YozV
MTKSPHAGPWWCVLGFLGWWLVVSVPGLHKVYLGFLAVVFLTIPCLGVLALASLLLGSFKRKRP